MAKSDKHVLIQRISDVHEMLINGYSYHEICQQKSVEYGVTTRQIGRYIFHARKKIEKAVDEKIEVMLRKNITRLEKIFQVAMNKKMVSESGVFDAPDLTAGVQAIKEINSMLGLNKKNIDVKSGDEKLKSFDFSKLGVDEIKEILKGSESDN